MLGVVRLSHVISGDRNSSGTGGSALLQGLHVIISSSTDEVSFIYQSTTTIFLNDISSS
jgi:hexosaminidase